MLLGRSRSGPKTPGMEMSVVFAAETRDTGLRNVHIHRKENQTPLSKAKATAPLAGVLFQAGEKEAKEKANPLAQKAKARPR